MNIVVTLGVCAVLLVGACPAATAQDPAWRDQPTDEPRRRNRDEPSRALADSLGLKSPRHAATLSILATILPIVGATLVSNNTEGTGGSSDQLGAALGLSGILFGPSVGYFYGHCAGRGRSGILIRSGILAVAALSSSAFSWSGDGGDDGIAMVGALAGIAVVVDDIVDITSVRRHVREENARRMAPEPAVSLVVKPMPGSGEFATGLQVTF